MVLRNGTGKPIHLAAGRLVSRVMVANAIPDAVPSPKLEVKLGEESEKPIPLTSEQRQELLMEVLEKNGNLGNLDAWPPETVLKAKRLLMEFHHIFSLEPNEIGCTNVVEHVIELLPDQNKPFKERFRCIAPHEVEEVRQHLQEMLDGGAIQPSQLLWCNAVVLVRKKDRTLRFCIDFCRLNTHTKKDADPIPRGAETIETLVGLKYFSMMDLKSGFWQVKVAEESCQYTAFMVGSMGVYEFLRMPYGLCNAPATFQRLMQNCLGELNLTFALIYLDDVIVYSRMPEDHLKQLHAVFNRFAHHGLKLKPTKCHFLKESLTYLGHEISTKGMLPGQEGIKSIVEMAPPMMVTGVRRFIGATGFFCQFIKNFARIAKPLQDLLGCENAKLKNHPVTLSEEALTTFTMLKEKCVTAPVLAYADLEKPFLLETDTSADGLGAVLQQKLDDSKYHPVAYASRALHSSEKHYHSSKLEFLTLKWAVTEQFKEYLLYKLFAVWTDNNPLTYILMTPNLDATGHRWVSILADFNMKIEYLCSMDNKVANALSRVESCLDDNETKQFLDTITTEKPGSLDESAVKEVIDRAWYHHIPRAESDNPALMARHEELEEQVAVDLASLVATCNIKHNLTGTNWKVLQEKDPILQHVLAWKKPCRKLSKKEKQEIRDGVSKDTRDRQTLEEYLLTRINAFNAKLYGN